MRRELGADAVESIDECGEERSTVGEVFSVELQGFARKPLGYRLVDRDVHPQQPLGGFRHRLDTLSVETKVDSRP
ncbi:MAG: hypothetical protein KC731_24280 [Myxococcales bacterium]|nr:hypothetical protein [Myxococcales bacterium]